MKVHDDLEIPDDELSFEVSRAGGPGGQNVNKVETRVTVRLDVASCSRLQPAQRDRVRERLATRINRDGLLRVTSQRHRSQKANRDAAVERLAELLAWALSEAPPRVATRTPRRAQARRLADKQQQAERKRRRAPIRPLDD